LIGIAGTGALLALHWVLFFSSVQDSGVAVATQTFATFPLIMVFLDSVTRGRMPATVEIGAGAVIVIAAVLLVGRGLPNTRISRCGNARCLRSWPECLREFGSEVRVFADQKTNKSVPPFQGSLSGGTLLVSNPLKRFERG
jgi:hypothetical protein